MAYGGGLRFLRPGMMQSWLPFVQRSQTSESRLKTHLTYIHAHIVTRGTHIANLDL